MADMLVNLLKLPDNRELVEKLKQEGIRIRRVAPYESSILREVASGFSLYWADEVTNSFIHQPPTCFIATRERKIIGFAAYESTRRNYFGPTGVLSEYRGKGIGKALLVASLQAMFDYGYTYAIIGGVGPAEFYAKAVGATAIPDSTPGIYEDLLSRT
jgi:ribosomal protein S18 acetylase RimI-like enzyme